MVYRPYDMGLLTCRQFPTVEGETDLDAVGLLNRAYDAWKDCRDRLEKIKELQANP